MSLATYEAVRHETRETLLMRKIPAEFLGTGHQCKDGYCHQLSVIFESVETSIRIVGLYLGVVPPTCILVLSIVWFFVNIESNPKINFVFVIHLNLAKPVTKGFVIWHRFDFS
jgi:hypothetical protein